MSSHYVHDARDAPGPLAACSSHGIYGVYSSMVPMAPMTSMSPCDVQGPSDAHGPCDVHEGAMSLPSPRGPSYEFLADTCSRGRDPG